MAGTPHKPADFTLMAIGQKGRLQYEAILLAGSLRLTNPALSANLVICEPQPGPLWKQDPRMDEAARDVLQSLGGT